MIEPQISVKRKQIFTVFSLFFDGILPNFVSHFSVERRGKAEIPQKVRAVLPLDHK